ncbi:DUF4177 domain-containing protein [Raoultibacter massiliensis]|uniref:DUF4177 domain-containing protein n=1 Tax=Raoultibacter massiliensis TaxID=1852371 RepID=A0ABV1JCT0_9ACTN|nr:DUF4177 domain-containing protein [Raoultibacter massiliensis]
MKKYEYASIAYETLMFAFASEHRAVIDDYAARGYRYVDSIITETDAHGRPRKLDLIFEIDA